MDFLIGFILSLLIAILSYKKKSLNLSGAIAATLFGTLIYGMGTYIMFVLLISFFLSSSIIQKIKHLEKEEKDGRNFIQVIANILAATIFSVIYFVTKEQIFMVVAAVGIAASTSDTWASEIGKTSKGKIVSIVNFKEVPRGESGGVSLLGTLSSLFGSIFISFLFILLYGITFEFSIALFGYFIMITIGGFLGCVFDSYLGIFLQAKYIELKTGKKIEKRTNHGEYKLVSGLPFVNNDMVNLLSTVCIAIIFALILI
ncbi:DUF92 domain-containing protein [Acholeplasma hippikon]|nr:DUF92 domain-containing protein [Acholeplasma hippikon]